MDNNQTDKAQELCSRAQELEKNEDNEDLDMAAQFYEQAAELGSSKGAYETGKAYMEGFVVERDLASAFKWFRQAAETGYTEAFSELATLYEFGLGIEQNWKEAAKWHLKSAKQGCEDSMKSLCYIYDRGLGVQRNEEKAAEWCRKVLQKCEDTFWKEAGCDEEEIVEKDLDNLGEIRQILGFLILRGVIKPTDQHEEFICLLSVAVMDGMVRAQNRVGWLFSNGKGVSKDEAKAVKWYLKAAEQRYADALYNLAVAFRKGQGVKKDGDKAVKLYREAVEQGYADAAYDLGDMYGYGDGVKKDTAKAREWFRKATELGRCVEEYKIYMI